MSEEIFSREALLIGDQALARLHGRHVAVFGVGGVGGYAVEALARAGIGALTLIDADVVALSNLNRQLVATLDTVGMPKVEAFRSRISRIAPDCRITCLQQFYLPENASEIDLTAFDFVVDAVDTVSAKLELAVRCQALHVPIISAMGAGNKLDPSKLMVTDIYETSTCPLARVMRRELRKRGVAALPVVYSTEEARTPLLPDGTPSRTPGSISFVPGAAGLLLASVVVRELMREDVG